MRRFHNWIIKHLPLRLGIWYAKHISHRWYFKADWDNIKEKKLCDAIDVICDYFGPGHYVYLNVWKVKQEADIPFQVVDEWATNEIHTRTDELEHYGESEHFQHVHGEGSYTPTKNGEENV